MVLKGQGNQRTAKCPFHKDGTASFSLNAESQVWHCHAGCGGGSVVDLIAKFDGKAPEIVFKEMATALEQTAATPPQDAVKPTIDTIYPYVDEFGREVYQAIRLKPKSFRQRHKGPDGKWVWTMEGVTRVLYRLPDVLRAPCVWIVEGEKDADSLNRLGFVATCNVGGAGKWLDSYTDHLTGKEVVLCGDNDEPGQKHMDLVFNSIAGKVRTARKVNLPKTVKDVSDFIAANPATAQKDLERMYGEAQVFTKGLALPIYTMAEIEPAYKAFAQNLDKQCVDLSRWLPGLGRSIRRLVPGELVTVIADTGVGKTGVLQNIALSQLPIPTLMFQMELPKEMIFERFLAIHSKNSQGAIESAYAGGYDTPRIGDIDRWFHNLLICDRPKLTVETVEDYINKSELKLGERPKLVLVDYIGLMAGPGKSKTERISEIAEGLKIVAKSTGTVVIMACQVTRNKNAATPELSLHDAKDSGSIENSSGLLIGTWRKEKDYRKMIFRVLKCTKGRTGPNTDVEANFDGETMNITPISPIEPADYPN